MQMPWHCMPMRVHFTDNRHFSETIQASLPRFSLLSLKRLQRDVCVAHSFPTVHLTSSFIIPAIHFAAGTSWSSREQQEYYRHHDAPSNSINGSPQQKKKKNGSHSAVFLTPFTLGNNKKPKAFNTLQKY
jgi:hypothetical protein